jgi:phage tail protein X
MRKITIQDPLTPWDLVAKMVYGGEQHTSVLLEANPNLVGTFFLPTGSVLVVPDLTKTEIVLGEAVPWRN